MKSWFTKRYIKWGLFFLLGFLILVRLTQSEHSVQSVAMSSAKLTAKKGRSIEEDNFSEHLNALTQRLNLVMDENQKIKETQRYWMSVVDEMKKKTVETSEDLSSRALKTLKQDLDRLEQRVSNFKNEKHQVSAEPLQESWEILKDLHVVKPLVQDLPEPAVIKEIYTLPSGSTLAQSMTMSALIGRIPVEGVIKSPYPFKIILGRENLIANGWSLPEIQGAIVQGYSVGDMTLSCVRGVVTELTFLFPNGRIVNTRVESESIEQLNHALGYLSEPDGNPCLAGHFYSSALNFLSGEVALGTLAGASKGLSLAQQTSTVTPYGSQYANSRWAQSILGMAGEEGISRVQAWWAARQKDSFDVIYVPSGRPVVINITQTIAIDDDSRSRKLNYEISGEPG